MSGPITVGFLIAPHLVVLAEAAMHEARARGYRMAILHSSALGVGIYRALGFRDVCAIGQHVWSPPGSGR